MAWMWGGAGLLVIALIIFLVVVNTEDSDSEGGNQASDGCEYLEDGTGAAGIGTPPTDNVSSDGTVTLDVTTDQGAMVFSLDRSLAPCAVNSFEFLAQAGFFDNTPCHRLTTEQSGFGVLQCGDPTGQGTGGPGYSFAEEPPTSDDPYPEGTLAMANSGTANSTGSQFFICYTSCSALPPNYSSVGTVTEGLDVVKQIAAAGVSGGGSDGAPATPVTIQSIVLG